MLSRLYLLNTSVTVAVILSLPAINSSRIPTFTFRIYFLTSCSLVINSILTGISAGMFCPFIA